MKISARNQHKGRVVEITRDATTAHVRLDAGTSIATLVGREGATLLLSGLGCLDDTPLLDIKPDRTLFTPIAPAQAGDFEVR